MSKDDGADEGTRVYVGGLTESVKKEDLELEFEKFGKLNSVWVAFNPPGFAFIEFCNQTDAETACDNLNGTDLMGSKLRVEIARGKRRGGFRGGAGSRAPWRRGGSFGGDQGYRSGRGTPRFDSYGGGRRGGRDYGNNRSVYGGGRSGYDSRSSGGAARYRSRSPVSRPSY